MTPRGLRLAVLGLASTLAGCLSFHRGAMPGEPKAATYAVVEGTRVRYSDSADDADEARRAAATASPVVLIHGFASSLETWTAVAPVLREKHRVLSLDLKGFGWTDRPEGDYSPAAQARLVLALMDERKIDKAAVVAHSWGSSVALALAMAAPERVTRLALYDAWVYEDQLPSAFVWARAGGVGEAIFGAFYDERPGDKMARAFFDQRFVTEALVEDVERSLARPGTAAAALAAVRGQRFAEMEGLYAKIDKPTLLLWGREDQVTFLTFGERLVRTLPRAKLVVYPQCGHFPMIEAASASTRDLAAFLDEETR